ncbi:serine/threonine-protein kinase ATR-like [Antedon mediterranea]|uniref:serine/threonine-protein kinase ATR-like n=1 Tax=Antedon mediterranea TaxID=105859 RepID=UPI003AF7E6FB
MLQETDTMCTQPRERATLQTVRRIFCQLVQDHLTNITKVSRELSKKGTPESVVILNFMKFCIQQFPQIFCCSAVHSSDDSNGATNQSTIDPEYYLCKNLSCWILLKLIRILNEYDCEPIHSQVQDIVCILLKNFRFKCPRMFHELISDFIDLLTELSEIHDRDFNGGEIQLLEEGIIFQYFQVNSKDLLKYKDAEEEFSVLLSEALPLTIEYYYSCYYLQLYFSNILKDLISDICHLCVRNVPLLWMTFAHQLDQGQIQVKLVSLDLISQLIETSGLYSQEITDYLFEMMAGLLQRVSSNHCDVMTAIDKEKLEAMLGKCLLQVFAVSQDKPRYCLSPYNIDLMMVTVIKCLVEGKILQRETADILKHSMCHILHYVYSFIPSGYESTNDIRMKRSKILNTALIQYIGCSKSTQFLVPPLVCAIQRDLGNTILPHKSSISASESDGGITTTTTDVSSSSGDERYEKGKARYLGRTPLKQTKKRHLEETVSPKYSSQVFQEITSQLTTLVEKNDGDMIEEVLEGIRSIIEITCRCCASSVTKETSIGSSNVKVTPSKLTPSKMKTYSHKNQQKNFLNSWLNDEDQGCVFQKWCSTMQSMILYDKNQDRVQRCFRVIVQSITSLLSIIDCWSVSASIQHKFAWLLSLPWLAMESSWLDLKIQGAISTKEIGEMSSSLVEKTTLQNRSLCIQGLSLFPREIASKWRTHIFRNSLANENEDVRQAAVKYFPWLLYSLGPNSSHLVFDLLHVMVKDKSIKVQEEMSKSIGNLVCTLARQTKLKRKSSFDNKLYMQIYLQCDVCSKCAAKQTDSTLKATTVEPDAIFPFVQLIEGSTDVQLGFSVRSCFRSKNRIIS